MSPHPRSRLAVVPALAFTLALVTLGFAACGGSEPPATTPDPAAHADDPAAADGTAPASAPAGPAVTDAELSALMESSVTMTEQLLTAASLAGTDCKVMAEKLAVVLADNADLMARDEALAAVPDIDARLEALIAANAELGTRAGNAQRELQAALLPCSDSEDVAKVFETLGE